MVLDEDASEFVHIALEPPRHHIKGFFEDVHVREHHASQNGVHSLTEFSDLLLFEVEEYLFRRDLCGIVKSTLSQIDDYCESTY